MPGCAGLCGVIGEADRKACSLCLVYDAHNVMYQGKGSGEEGSKASTQRGFADGHKGNMPRCVENKGIEGYGLFFGKKSKS